MVARFVAEALFEDIAAETAEDAQAGASLDRLHRVTEPDVEADGGLHQVDLPSAHHLVSHVEDLKFLETKGVELGQVFPGVLCLMLFKRSDKVRL